MENAGATAKRRQDPPDWIVQRHARAHRASGKIVPSFRCRIAKLADREWDTWWIMRRNGIAFIPVPSGAVELRATSWTELRVRTKHTHAGSDSVATAAIPTCCRSRNFRRSSISRKCCGGFCAFNGEEFKSSSRSRASGLALKSFVGKSHFQPSPRQGRNHRALVLARRSARTGPVFSCLRASLALAKKLTSSRFTARRASSLCSADLLSLRRRADLLVCGAHRRSC